jgi:hypothetical protein
VTEGNGHVIDPAGAARAALQAAVTEHGPQALSDVGLMDRIGRDKLAGLPGEAILIGSAARADVPALLRERIPRLGNYGAIQSIATTLSEANALDLAACVWVVREFARALGFIAPAGTQPAAGAGAGGVTDQGDLLPPVAAEYPETIVSPIPVVPAGPGGGGEDPVPGAAPAGRRPPGRNALGIGAAVLLVAVYLLVAAVAHLTPFPATTVVASSSGSSSGSGNSPAPVPDASPDAAPDGSPDAAPDPAPDQDASPSSAYTNLLALIPETVQDAGDCSSTGPGDGATAEAECGDLEGLPAITIYYYLYSSQGALSNGFSSFLTANNFSKGSTPCAASSTFVAFENQCETDFTNVSPAMTGNIAEYTSKSNDPIIVSSDNQQLAMAVMIGANDDDLLGYWKQLQWIQT